MLLGYLGKVYNVKLRKTQRRINEQKHVRLKTYEDETICIAFVGFYHPV